MPHSSDQVDPKVMRAPLLFIRSTGGSSNSPAAACLSGVSGAVKVPFPASVIPDDLWVPCRSAEWRQQCAQPLCEQQCQRRLCCTAAGQRRHGSQPAGQVTRGPFSCCAPHAVRATSTSWNLCYQRLGAAWHAMQRQWQHDAKRPVCNTNTAHQIASRTTSGPIQSFLSSPAH